LQLELLESRLDVWRTSHPGVRMIISPDARLP
jgi:hypothetical protein